MRAYRLRLLTVANGFRHVNADNLTAAQRLLDVVARLRLGTKDLDGGLYRLGRHSAARQKSAATGADDQRVKIGNLFGDFEPTSALARHHRQIVVGRDEHGVALIEDAAQAFLSATGGQMLGTWGNLSTLSFNSKKTIHCGQGGAIVINDASYFKRAEILRDRGTNRAQFLAGEVDEYSWQEPGTSFSPSELNMAFLYAQLEAGESIVQRTREIFFRYAAALEPLASAGLCTLPGVAEKHGHNGSLFYLLLPDLSQRQELIAYLKQNAIIAQFHFVPLHLGEGRKFTKIPFFPSQSQELYERLVRLPLFHAMSDAEVDYVAKHVAHFLSDRTAKIKKS